MKFIKKKNEEREDYILQDNTKTKVGARFIIITLILLIIGVIISGIYLRIF
ncbi:hypothetical protein [Aquimarina algicola]|uniref:hypothetical protein n=1 Tax=Aquimarina algicola TaxID=2589995 RepID=UPI001CF44F48|nr:hypothetical protein [Aquimarina algicola]